VERQVQTAIPDLRGIPVDKLADLEGTVLASSIALYRERLKQSGVTLSSFQARI
jgi:hypothetical protein